MKRIILMLIAVADLFFMGYIYSSQITGDISDNLLRLHIIANSNTPLDQHIKTDIRDIIIAKTSDERIKNKKDVAPVIREINKDVEEYLNRIKAPYGSSVMVCKDYFPSKKYDNIALPAGGYDSIKVILGKGEGKNWWCVAYPPLCFSESVCGELSKKGEKELLSKLLCESYGIIKGDTKEYKIKFKAVELINEALKRIKA